MASLLINNNKNETSITIFVGYDHRLPLNFHIFMHSVIKHATHPIKFMPLDLNHLKKILTREKTAEQLTDFSYSRFLVPYLCNYQGWGLFLDGTDMMLRDDISKLWDLKNEQFDLMLVKHKNIDNHSFMGKTISSFPMFNWASLMLFNNEKCTKLNPEYVNTAPYHDLHQFKWLDDHNKIGELPAKWNYLVGYNEPRKDVSLVHWTNGAPQLNVNNGMEYENEWHEMSKEFSR